MADEWIFALGMGGNEEDWSYDFFLSDDVLEREVNESGVSGC